MDNSKDFRVGDKVMIRDRIDWPKPPGFILAGAIGKIVKWVDYEEPMQDFSEFVHVEIKEAHGSAKDYIGNTFAFQTVNLKKI